MFKEEQSSLKYQAGGSYTSIIFFFASAFLCREIQDIFEEKVNTFLISESPTSSGRFCLCPNKQRIILSGIRSLCNFFN